MWHFVITRLFTEVIGRLREPSVPRSAYGPLVDTWRAYVPMRGNLETDLQGRVVRKMQAKGLSDLAVTHQKLTFYDPPFTSGGRDAQEHIVFTQSSPSGAKAAFALRIARHGLEDLDISWRLFERNARTEANVTIGPTVGAIVILIVMVLIVSGSRGNMFDGSILYSLFVMIVGLSLALVLLFASFLGRVKVSKGASTVSTYDHGNTLLLAEMVCHVLMDSLDELGVERYELRVVQQAQVVGT